MKAPGDVSGWFKNDKSTQVSYMSSIKSILHKQIDLTSENNIYGSGQWVFVNYAMAGYGFGQIAIAHPELKDSCLKEMKFCIEKLLSDKVKEFDVEAWGEDPIETLNGPNEHVAYLGYLNLLLGMHRMLDKNSEFARLNDTITHTLVKRFEKNNRFLLETYPGVIFPADNAPAIGSIGLYSKATGSDYKAFLKKWTTGFKELYIDKETKIPVQSIAPVIGPAESKTDVNNFSIPRGSGAAACIYFLSFADKELAESIYNNLKKELKVTFGAFGAVKEYPAKYKNHKGDVDSGPVVLGMSISATGFVVSGAKVFNDYPFFKKLCSLVYLVGIPEQKSKSFRFKIAGNMGNAMMFAMLTANTKLLAN
ncbi:MAG: hypothetical protein U0W24_15580 [Bacteroidales bacterium]